MTPWRIAAALAIGALLLSCTAIVGLNRDMHDIVDDMCLCNKQLGFLGTSEACKLYLRDHLTQAGDEDRAAWLNAYVDGGCTDCDGVKDCFYRAPLCAPAQSGCSMSEECCSFVDGGGCNGNVCN